MRKTMLLLIALPVLAYLGLCGLMFAKQREMIYFPQYTRLPASETNLAIERDGVTLRGWLANAGNQDALVYFGGNAESLQGMRGLLAARFPERSIYLLAYRGYGASEGVPTESLLFEDALVLFDHVAKRHPEGEIAVIGRSLGSGVASYLASKRPVRGLVLVTPFESLAGVGQHHYPWLPVRWLAMDRYESARHLAGFNGPVMVLQAADDRVVPAASTQRLVASLPRPPRRWVQADADHDSALTTEAEWKALVEFLGALPPPG